MKKAIQVQCYSGSRYGERPLSFSLHDETYVVKVVERSWRTPSNLHFRVRTEEGEIFELAYDDGSDTWCVRTPLELQEDQE